MELDAGTSASEKKFAFGGRAQGVMQRSISGSSGGVVEGFMHAQDAASTGTPTSAASEPLQFIEENHGDCGHSGVKDEKTATAVVSAVFRSFMLVLSAVYGILCRFIKRCLTMMNWTISCICPPPRHKATIAKLPLVSPQATLALKPLTVVLDLDETLVHAAPKPVVTYDIRISVSIQNRMCDFYVCKRPFVSLFLGELSKFCRVIVFTASLQSYADAIVDWIDGKRVIERRYFRDSCVKREGSYLKDLAVIPDCDMSRTVIIDNSPIAYALCSDNALPISTWTSDPNDDELLTMLPILGGLSLVSDVRSLLSIRNTNAVQQANPSSGVAMSRGRSAISSRPSPSPARPNSAGTASAGVHVLASQEWMTE